MRRADTVVQPGVAQTPFAGRVRRVDIILDVAHAMRGGTQLTEQQNDDEQYQAQGTIGHAWSMGQAEPVRHAGGGVSRVS